MNSRYPDGQVEDMDNEIVQYSKGRKIMLQACLVSQVLELGFQTLDFLPCTVEHPLCPVQFLLWSPKMLKVKYQQYKNRLMA
jgi:hypothetical protein